MPNKKKSNKVFTSDSSANPKLAAASHRRLTRGEAPRLLAARVAPQEQPVSQRVTEFVYRWSDGREEVKYRRPYNSTEALELINEVIELQKKHGKNCPYFYRHVG